MKFGYSVLKFLYLFFLQALPSSVFVVHGGTWNYNKYEGGIKDFIPIPQSGITFEELLGKIEVRLKKDRNTYVFDIDALIQPSVGDTFRMKITDNFEWCCLSDLMEVPTIYVTVCKKSNDFEQSSIIPLKSGNFQNHDYVGVDSCSVPTLHISSDSSSAYHNGTKQWVIPGASYQASLPCDDVVVQPERVRGELACGSTFDSKDMMTEAVGLYHLRNCLEFRTKRSDMTRFHIVCKNEKRCKFSMRSKGYGLSWRVEEWVPHTCEFDLRTGSHPKVSSKAVALHVGANLMEDGSVLRPRDIQAQVLREFGVSLKYSAALAARNVALNVTFGNQEESFQVHLFFYVHNCFFVNIYGGRSTICFDFVPCTWVLFCNL